MYQLPFSHPFWLHQSFILTWKLGGAESTVAEKHQDREEEKGNPVSWLSS